LHVELQRVEILDLPSPANRHRWVAHEVAAFGEEHE